MHLASNLVVLMKNAFTMGTLRYFRLKNQSVYAKTKLIMLPKNVMARSNNVHVMTAGQS